MRKWTKGFLIFGVVSTILGFIMMIVSAQSGGVQSLLAMSKDPVYDHRIEEVTFGDEVEKLDLALKKHSLTITESVDDKIHISYHPSISGRHELTTSTTDKTLSVTDHQTSEHRFLGSGIEGLLRVASSYSNRFDEVTLALPKGRTLKNINISANRGQTNINRATIENASIKSNGYLLRVNQSNIKNSQLSINGIINIFETNLTDAQIKSEQGHITTDNIQIYGKVELEAQTNITLMLPKEELQRINLNLSVKYGSIIHFAREGRYPIKKGEYHQDERLANPYKTEKADVKNQLIAKANQGIYLQKEEEPSSQSRNH